MVKRLTNIHLYINLKIKHSHKAAILQVQLYVDVPCDALNHAKLFNHLHITNCTFSLLEGVGLVGDRGAVWVAFGSLATPTGTSGTELSLLSFTGPAFWSFGSTARSAVRGERGGGMHLERAFLSFNHISIKFKMEANFKVKERVHASARGI